MYLHREAEQTLAELFKGFPVVVLTGPRQSGKSTLAQHVFAGRPYATLEDPDEEAFARNDPRGFLAQFPDGAVLDEIQRCPQLLSYLQGIADQDGRMGLYLLTGSQQFGLTAGVTQTLAGRAALVELLPFSSSELRQAGRLPESVDDLLFSGFYPPLHDRGIAPSVWHPNYIRTYIERDLRQMITVSDLHTFQDFLSLCAGRVGQLVNLSSLANDCAISPNTAKAWLSVLEASYIIHLLRPHHKNFNKRIIKTPKLYFYDVGLAARLLGIENREQLHNHAYRGALFETFVIAELLKKRYNAGQPSNLYFWRDRTGNEIDVLVDRGDHLLPVEIKSGRTVTEAYFKGLRNWTAVAGKEAGRPYLVYAGNKRQERQEAAVVPWFDAALIGD